MAVARQPVFKIFYNKKDITKDISGSLIQVSYQDNLIGEADEIDIRLEDSDGLWSNEWYPVKGDKLKLQMGFNDLLVDCGEFEIDEMQISGPPSIIGIKGLASWLTSAMRTKKTKASDGQTIKDIATKIANENNLTLIGNIFTVRIARTNQYRETDLEYLNRLGDEYGFNFSVKGDKLVFTSIFDLENNPPIMEVDITDMLDYSFRDKASQVYQNAKVSYQNPITGKKVDKEVISNKDDIDFTYIRDTLQIYDKAESVAQAELKAKAVLHRFNTKQQSGLFSVPGDPLLVSGNNLDLTGLGVISGRYHIMSSSHAFDRNSGYVTTVEVKRVGFIDKVKNKRKSTKPKNQSYKVINENSQG
jgi:uncharacterized protein